MTFRDAVEKATAEPQYENGDTQALDRLTHAVLALALAIRERSLV